jgi:hypothetical protein
VRGRIWRVAFGGNQAARLFRQAGVASSDQAQRRQWPGSRVAVVERLQTKEKTLGAMLEEAKGANAAP